MNAKKQISKKPIKQEVIAKKSSKSPQPGTWAAVAKGAEYARKAGLQNWPG